MTKSRKFWLLAASSLSFVGAAPAFAQDADGAAAVSDIIVTARRVDEKLQDVPISITVFNQEQLDKRNVISANDLAAYTPSLSVSTRFGADYASFSIRGFFQENRTTASVGSYFADVVAPRGGGSTQGGDGAGPGSFFDLQNVQVLKGPQGTLFGRNTTGGAVLLVPKKPTDKLEGYIEGGFGNYNMRRLQGVLNVPLADTFKVRAGFDTQKRDGYLRNISGIGPKDFADIDYFAARLSILAELTPDLENYTVASYARSSPNGSIPKVTNCFPNSVGTFGVTNPADPNYYVAPPNVGGPMVGRLVCDQLARDNVGWNVVENNIPDAKQQARQWQVINTTTWHASESLTIKNIASYAEIYNNQNTDLFGARYVIPATIGYFNRNTGAITNVDLASIGLGGLIGKSFNFVPANSIANGDSNSQSTFTEELQFQGTAAGGSLRWQAGGYFERSSPLGMSGNLNSTYLDCPNADAFQCTDYLGQIVTKVSGSSTPVTVGSVSYASAKTTFQDIGLYAQADYDLTQRLKLTAGFRYTWDTTTTIADRVTYRFPIASVPTAFCTNPLNRAPTNPLPDPNAVDLCQSPQRQVSKAPTWVIGLDFTPVDDLLLYAKWARGYRQGATQPFGPDGLAPFKQEKVDTYEVGVKSSFRGAVSGSFNIAAFYNNFRNQQITASYSLPRLTGVAPNAGIVNAGKSRIYGIEAEATLIPFEGLRIQAAYAYLNTRIQSLDPLPEVPAFFPATQLTFVGSRLPFTPDHKISVDASYTLPIDARVGEISVGTTFSYTSSQFYQGPGNDAARALYISAGLNPVFNIPGFSLWNLNANWDNVFGSNLDASFFMTNVANKHYYLAPPLQPTSGFISGYVAEPRMWGFKLRYNF